MILVPSINYFKKENKILITLKYDKIFT
jgi:hypothetical protein